LALVLTLLVAPMAGAVLPEKESSPPAEEFPPNVDSAVVEEIRAEGAATFFVVLRDKADLRGAYAISDWNKRGAFVYNVLRRTAERSQAGVKALLESERTRGRVSSYEAHHIINTVLVKGGTQDVILQLASRPEVERIRAVGVMEIPRPMPGSERAGVDAVEWNIAQINADDVWSGFGVNGSGIVVANIDTGVEYTHSALVNQYRGNLGGSSFDHNYNWWDPTDICGDSPCDNVGHGSHTMGTMVGDDGGENQIGVAPGARWIATKGCEEWFCSDTSLISAAEWILAPWDLSGANPDPSKRPQVVNNSWGGWGGDEWYWAYVDAWRAAGIFPAFSIGNDGESGCESAGSPGDYAISFATGATDSNDDIAYFSSRGPAYDGGVKPDVSAPGVDVRSSVPGDDYDWFNGTSMASPHTAGTVALIWSAEPTYIGAIDDTESLLMSTAFQIDDFSCGGPYAALGDQGNNVYGYGRIDALAAVELVATAGTLEGHVTDADTLGVLQDASVQAVNLDTGASATRPTDGTGFYGMALLPGTYAVTASKYGYYPQTASSVVVIQDTTTVQDFALTSAPSYTVSGYVRDQEGNPIADVEVTVLDTPLAPAYTDGSGFYTLTVAEGEYDMQASAGPCFTVDVQHVLVSGDVTQDFSLEQIQDAFGYTCRQVPMNWVAATDLTEIVGDESWGPLDPTFAFPFYGLSYPIAYAATDGYLNFLEGNSLSWHEPIPNPWEPNAAVYPLWADLVVGAEEGIYTGAGPDGSFVVEWRDVEFFDDPTQVKFEVLLYPDGRILFQYAATAGPGDGSGATIGIENEDGTIALQYSYDEASVHDGKAILFTPPPWGYVEGYVTNANTGDPVEAAGVEVLETGRKTLTDAGGYYHFALAEGVYTLEASSRNCQSVQAIVEINVGETTRQDFALPAAQMGRVKPGYIMETMTLGQRLSRTLTIESVGSLDLDFRLRDLPGEYAPPVQRTRVEGYDANARTTEGLFAGSDEAQVIGPEAAGDVITSWPAPIGFAWGVGFDNSQVWLSDPLVIRDYQVTVDGNLTGVEFDTSWAGEWAADFAWDDNGGMLWQVNVGGDNCIYGLDPADGTVLGTICDPDGVWNWISQRGLAYRGDTDTFYIGGWNEDIVYHVKGPSWENPGEILDQFPLPVFISGLAWHPDGDLFVATNSYPDMIYKVDPTTGDILASFAHPEGGAFAGAGLATDGDGNLWMVSQNTNTVYLADSATPIGGASWLAEEPSSGTLAPGEVAEIRVTLDSREVSAAGLYQATIVINHNDPLRLPIHVPVVMEITGGVSPFFLPLMMRSFGGGAGIVNGDFEDGPTGWFEYSTHGWDLIVNSLPGIVTPHSGAWAVWLGGDYDELSYVEQQVTVPPGSPYLAYWHWI
ncbi:MAG TPA: S8 family serine peptidase, partial [Anaerolineae bacterium]|nr:S8 family serine peptidase [Anaerolineae bacterium]